MGLAMRRIDEPEPDPQRADPLQLSLGNHPQFRFKKPKGRARTAVSVTAWRLAMAIFCCDRIHPPSNIWLHDCPAARR